MNADLQFETTKLTVKNTAFLATGPIPHDLRAGAELIRRERRDAESAPGGTDERFAVFAVNEMILLRQVGGRRGAARPRPGSSPRPGLRLCVIAIPEPERPGRFRRNRKKGG